MSENSFESLKKNSQQYTQKITPKNHEVSQNFQTFLALADSLYFIVTYMTKYL